VVSSCYCILMTFVFIWQTSANVETLNYLLRVTLAITHSHMHEVIYLTKYRTNWAMPWKRDFSRFRADLIDFGSFYGFIGRPTTSKTWALNDSNLSCWALFLLRNFYYSEVILWDWVKIHDVGATEGWKLLQLLFFKYFKNLACNFLYKF
jgi:hypothetical protein